MSDKTTPKPLNPEGISAIPEGGNDTEQEKQTRKINAWVSQAIEAELMMEKIKESKIVCPVCSISYKYDGNLHDTYFFTPQCNCPLRRN